MAWVGAGMGGDVLFFLMSTTINGQAQCVFLYIPLQALKPSAPEESFLSSHYERTIVILVMCSRRTSILYSGVSFERCLIRTLKMDAFAHQNIL